MLQQTHGARGAEVWVTRDGSEPKYKQETSKLGNIILQKLGNLGISNRGVKESPKGNTTAKTEAEKEYYYPGFECDFYGMIRYPRFLGIPAIIVEHCFISNYSDSQFINNDSKIRAIAKADADAIAQYYGLVLKSAVTGVTLNQSSKTINKGENFTLIATVNPSTANNKNVTWSSSNPAVATVDGYGKVLGLSSGTTTITVKTEDGNKTATCTVTVNIPVTSVTLNQTNKIINKGDSFKLTATINPTDSTNKNITWSSSDTKVATVDSSGTVKGINSGTVTITVKTADGGKIATCSVTVIVPVTGISLNETDKTVVKGLEFILTPTISPTNASNKSVTWKTSNSAIATVSETGRVKATGIGTATITATTSDGNKTATSQITVKDINLSEYVNTDNSLRENTDYVSNIDITNNTVEYIKSKIETNLPIIEAYKNGQLISGTTKIGTGTRIVAKRADGTIVKEYVIIIYGDVDGDGKITTADALMIQRSAVRLETFDEIQKKAGNTKKGASNPTTADALNVQRQAVRLYTIEQ